MPGVLKTVVTDGMGDGAFIIGMNDSNRSNKQILLAITAVVLPAGLVLGAVDLGVKTVTPGAPVSGSGGTVGNGAIGTVTADNGAPEGTWQVVITNPAANAGFFEVRRPDGSVDGDGAVGVAYNGGINFTLADGSNDWLEDDRIPIVVNVASGGVQYKPLDLAGVDGTQNFGGILWGRREINTATQRGTAVVRDQTVNGFALTWPAGITDEQKATLIEQAEAKGLIILF